MRRNRLEIYRCTKKVGTVWMCRSHFLGEVCYFLGLFQNLVDEGGDV